MITQDFINGYICALNTLLFSYRNELVSVRKLYYEGLQTDSDGILTCDFYDYKFMRSKTLKNIKQIRNMKNEYKKLVKEINSLIHS